MSDRRPAPTSTPTPTTSTETVLFVCEHGIAKSLIAKLLFERHAREAGLAIRAESRATAPDAALPDWALAGLGANRLDAGGFTPRPLAATDVEGAARVVSFDLPEVATTAAACSVKGEQWNELPMASEDFSASHAAIDARVRQLVQDLLRASEREPADTRQ